MLVGRVDAGGQSQGGQGARAVHHERTMSASAGDNHDNPNAAAYTGSPRALRRARPIDYPTGSNAWPQAQV